MSGCCDNSGSQRGGLIAEAVITKSKIDSSEISGATIKNLAEIDDASAKTIADALGNLTPEELASLAKAVAQALAPAIGKAPTPTTASELPVTLYGNRTALMGEPVRWMQMDGFVVPAYTEGA